MFIIKWLLKLSVYYWLLFIALVVFDVCPGNTIVGKLIKEYQIKLSKNMHTNTKNAANNVNTPSNQGATDVEEGLQAIVKIIEQLNQQQNIVDGSNNSDKKK